MRGSPVVIMSTKNISLRWPNVADELQFNSLAFSFLVCCLWDNAVGLPAFQKQLIFSGIAPRSLPTGRLVSAGREEHIDSFFIVRMRLMWNQIYWQLVSGRIKKKRHFRQLRCASIKPCFHKAAIMTEYRLINKDSVREPFLKLVPGFHNRYFWLVNESALPAFL